MNIAHINVNNVPNMVCCEKSLIAFFPSFDDKYIKKKNVKGTAQTNPNIL